MNPRTSRAGPLVGRAPAAHADEQPKEGEQMRGTRSRGRPRQAAGPRMTRRRSWQTTWPLLAQALGSGRHRWCSTAGPPTPPAPRTARQTGTGNSPCAARRGRPRRPGDRRVLRRGLPRRPPVEPPAARPGPAGRAVRPRPPGRDAGRRRPMAPAPAPPAADGTPILQQLASAPGSAHAGRHRHLGPHRRGIRTC